MATVHLVCPESVDWGQGVIAPNYIAQARQYQQRANQERQLNTNLPYGFLRFLEEPSGHWQIFVMSRGESVAGGKGLLTGNLVAKLPECNLLIHPDHLHHVRMAMTSAGYEVVEHHVGALKLDGWAQTY
ncbi:MAG TPA: hypothetical protein VD907_00415 [Verrucomicrobiae bacterium]|nr:hypothetical protein [Verrucomicrobiae bacterium]